MDFKIEIALNPWILALSRNSSLRIVYCENPFTQEKIQRQNFITINQNKGIIKK
jgi:hypothetical protein